MGVAKPPAGHSKFSVSPVPTNVTLLIRRVVDITEYAPSEGPRSKFDVVLLRRVKSVGTLRCDEAGLVHLQPESASKPYGRTGVFVLAWDPGGFSGA